MKKPCRSTQSEAMQSRAKQSNANQSNPKQCNAKRNKSKCGNKNIKQTMKIELEDTFWKETPTHHPAGFIPTLTLRWEEHEDAVKNTENI